MSNNRRVLVISNNCFSFSDSNGRTLGNLFYGWPKANLAQMCIIVRDPAWDVCNNYYCIEDRTVLSAFLRCRKAVGRKLVEQKTELGRSNNVETLRKNIVRKTLPKVMLREMVWARQRWRSKEFEEWIDAFNPELLVFQFGDTSFMIDIALYVAHSRNIPLLVYNTEGYYFFQKSWYYPSVLDIVLFPFYKQKYHKRVRELIEYASYSIYLNDELKKDYDVAFNKPSKVIYNSSSLHPSNVKPLDEPNKLPCISYLGWLGHERDQALIEVGEVLHSLNDRYHIDVYGLADEKMAERLRLSMGVEYHGAIPYERVKKVIDDSDILFYVEPISEFNEALRYGFSGKIADSLTSGKCLVIYAPRELSSSQYIINNKCGWYAGTKVELRDALLRIINNEEERNQILEHAKVVAKENHSYENNAMMFQSVLENI